MTTQVSQSLITGAHQLEIIGIADTRTHPQIRIYILVSKVRVQTPETKKDKHMWVDYDALDQVRNMKVNQNASLRSDDGDFLLLSPATLNVTLLDAVVGGAVLVVFLLVADTLDGLGVECEGTFGDEGSEENDRGADAELDTMETH